MTISCIFRLTALFSLPVALAGCQKTVTTHLPRGAAAYETLAVSPDVTYPRAHVLGPGDRIDVTVFREPDFSSSNLLIDTAGNVYLPMIGQLTAAGMTQAEMAAIVSERLGASYIRDPNVTVSVREAALQAVSVEGEVKQPGVYQIQPGYTLLTAISLARSPTSTAKLDEILVFREIDGQRMGARFDLAEIRAGRVPDPQVLPGDVIVVGYSQVRAVYQDILKAAPLFNIFTQF